MAQVFSRIRHCVLERSCAVLFDALALKLTLFCISSRVRSQKELVVDK